MATDSNVQQSSSGVRTYRGRTLEEILPQIRAELGPDAIILREREGLVGGVGGFFAQRFVEVDARRGEGQSIDIYDDAPESDLRIRRPPADFDMPVRSSEALPRRGSATVDSATSAPATEPERVSRSASFHRRSIRHGRRLQRRSSRRRRPARSLSRRVSHRPCAAALRPTYSWSGFVKPQPRGTRRTRTNRCRCDRLDAQPRLRSQLRRPALGHSIPSRLSDPDPTRRTAA